MKALVVSCHPNPDSLVAAAGERVLAGLRARGHEVRVNDLYADGFQPAMTADERRAHREPGVAAELARYADDLQWAEVLVLVYPTWWGGMPAMLKGWVDRVWVAGVAWDLPPGASVLRRRLTGLRRILVVTTHGSSKLTNAFEGEGGKRTASRAMRAMCATRARTTWCALYSVDRADRRRHARFLDRVERTASRL